ncbi:hypothetical protein WH50_20355 [Pokkaliibacter plantistimulans]|uniref:D-alanyl-D-alanine carboxypeptidase-like core domain-containing protein n=1 Tax=Pokkaliibacter plantistimulans TaxID=1635171 RepID=A0ABX5LVJ4_9GAMM|nr:M15 family metallopeptidase [Pokkaliibacter plantistimulans]PXF29498.1 hypothetical protein WH50_20355 [Pokkaliibacter plantistimulans]
MSTSTDLCSSDQAQLKALTHQWLHELGIDAALIDSRPLPFFAEATELVIAETNEQGREFQLTPHAAQAWQTMKAAAATDDVSLLMVSAYRSVDYQMDLIRRKQSRGVAADDILTVLAPPGCSEHHTGRAIDINTPDCDPASEDFAATQAFSWLQHHAAEYGFRLSFPPDNPWGYVYEPWHWCWHPA